MILITDLQIVEDFVSEVDNKRYGIYVAEFNGNTKVFARNGDAFKVLTHWVSGDELNLINDDVKEELLEAICLVKQLRCK